jgi:hypothetical protein
LVSGILYIAFGIAFTFFAVQQVKMNGFGLMAYLLIILATLDFGAGIRLVVIYFKKRNG